MGCARFFCVSVENGYCMIILKLSGRFEEVSKDVIYVLHTTGGL